MQNKKIRAIGAGVLAAVWLCLTGFAWFSQPKASSDAERRPLEQMPQLSVDTVLDGSFMKDFESYSLDQFPLRDSFRQVKSLFHYYGLQQKDNNDIYLADGYAAKLEYPLNQTSVDYAVSRFQRLYEKYLLDSGCKVYMAAVPDKGYYLAEENGYLAMDYEAMFAAFRQALPWAQWIDLTDSLDTGCYYRTDTHWRQEKLLGAAGKLCQAMGVTPPAAEDYTQTAIERPFYGVYYGQAALPMEPETMYIMESQLLSGCKVTVEMAKKTQVYDMEQLGSKDLYDVFLSGSKSFVTIENPNAQTDRELVIFRDSFGSSIAPLLVQGYKTVTLVDIRYINMETLSMLMDFHGQDVLLLYSTLVLNNSSTIK
ncbi:MAG: hypothetical protein IJB17_02250 [Oscillospiraceae bacterium]|nr:hypothetical protein [Oscillospiraceae bacterium]